MGWVWPEENDSPISLWLWLNKHETSPVWKCNSPRRVFSNDAWSCQQSHFLAESLPVCSVFTTNQNGARTSLHPHAHYLFVEYQQGCCPHCTDSVPGSCLAPRWCSVPISARMSDCAQVLCPCWCPKAQNEAESPFVPKGGGGCERWHKYQAKELTMWVSSLGRISQNCILFFFFQNFLIALVLLCHRSSYLCKLPSFDCLIQKSFTWHKHIF